MTLVYFFLGLAIALLVSHKICDSILYGKKETNNSKNTHAHNLVVDIGNTLINEKGVNQYQKLKPKLEQAKRYYLSNKNTQQGIESTETKLESVKLKVVS
jgi:hypothetical protein